MSPDAVARAVAFAIDQPDDVNVGEIVLRFDCAALMMGADAAFRVRNASN